MADLGAIIALLWLFVEASPFGVDREGVCGVEGESEVDAVESEILELEPEAGGGAPLLTLGAEWLFSLDAEAISDVGVLEGFSFQPGGTPTPFHPTFAAAAR